MLVIFVIMLGLFNGFVEELGWAGFLTPRFRSNYRFIATGLNVGVMRGLWHLLSNYVGQRRRSRDIPFTIIRRSSFIFLPSAYYDSYDVAV